MRLFGAALLWFCPQIVPGREVWKSHAPVAALANAYLGRLRRYLLLLKKNGIPVALLE